MLFASKFCSHLEYCKITHDIAGIVFKRLSFQYKPSKRLPIQS